MLQSEVRTCTVPGISTMLLDDLPILGHSWRILLSRFAIFSYQLNLFWVFLHIINCITAAGQSHYRTRSLCYGSVYSRAHDILIDVREGDLLSPYRHTPSYSSLDHHAYSYQWECPSKTAIACSVPVYGAWSYSDAGCVVHSVICPSQT